MKGLFMQQSIVYRSEELLVQAAGLLMKGVEQSAWEDRHKQIISTADVAGLLLV